jgi:hypothetical protein
MSNSGKYQCLLQRLSSQNAPMVHLGSYKKREKGSKIGIIKSPKKPEKNSLRHGQENS